MATIGSLVVNLQINNTQFNTQINQAAQNMARATRQMQSNLTTLERNLHRIGRALGTFITVGLMVRAAREVADYADAWKIATNQVAAANAISDLQARSMESLNEIAIKTRTSLADTAELYGKLLRSTNGVAKSEQEVARATELVNKAFKAGGASMQEQVNGIRQLAQSLASGIFQGDELRSIRENAPLLAQAIAEEFNTTIGGLKKLGAEGALTADRVFKAILKGAKPIEDAFDATNATITDSFTILGNSITQYVGFLDSASGASKSFTERITEMAKAIREATKAPTGTSEVKNIWTDLTVIVGLFNKAVNDAIADMEESETFKKLTKDAKDLAVALEIDDELRIFVQAWKDSEDATTLSLENIHRQLDRVRGKIENVTSAVKTFHATQARTGVGAAIDMGALGTPQLGWSRGITRMAKPLEDQLKAVAEWRAELQGGTGDMDRLAAAAARGTKALEETTLQIEAENAVLKLLRESGVPVINLMGEYERHLIEVYKNAKRAADANQEVADSFDEIQDVLRDTGQQKLLQLALTMGVGAYRDLKIHIDALNEAQARGIDITQADAAAKIALIEQNIRLGQETERLREKMDEVANTINATVGSAIGQVSSAFADAIVEGENFRDMLDGLLKDLAKLAINSMMQLFLKQIIGGVGTTGAPGTGLLGGISLHSGGIVGRDGSQRTMPASLFSAAPRFHGGLRANEMPAILQKGEGVFTKDQMKAMGGGTTNNFTVINQAPNTTTTEDRQSNASGGTDITVFIRQAMTKEISDPASSVHKSLKSNFGLSQAGVRR